MKTTNRNKVKSGDAGIILVPCSSASTAASLLEGESTRRCSVPIETLNPEVSEKKTRRYCTAQYKLQILEEADACTEPGKIGALLRREGPYFSNLMDWRRQRRDGILYGVSPKKRGRKPMEENPLSERVAELEEQNQRLQNKLKKAELITDGQKKFPGCLECRRRPTKERNHERCHEPESGCRDIEGRSRFRHTAIHFLSTYKTENEKGR